MWDKLITFFGGNLVKEVGTVVDNLTTSDDEKAKAKAAIGAIVTEGLTKLAQAQAEVIQTEMKGSFLQKNWRPMVMLAFAFILIMKWFGFTDDSIPTALEMELMSLLEIGIGGYVAGRTIEKVSDTLTKNIDLSHLRKKDRKDAIN
jgi:hypothetical protein